jgi:hypothetical protein
MTAVKTMQIRIVKPQAERVIADLASQNLIEIDEPDETSLDRYKRWSRECAERRERRGVTDEYPPLSMEEIVAIVKETRAEMYAEEQARKNTVGC